MDKETCLILPGTTVFNETLSQVPFWWKEYASQNDGWCNFGVDVESGLLKPLNKRETHEYLFGGEFEERIKQIELDPTDVWCDYSQEELEGVESFFIDL